MAGLKQEFEKEIMRFLLLCSQDDVKILVYKYKKEKMPEYVRLGCIALTFGFKKMFTNIFQRVERNKEDFFSGLDNLNGNLPQLEIWVEDFIKNIRHAAAQNLCREFWTTRKTELDKPDFTVKSLL